MFTVFSQLPHEIRTEVWRFALAPWTSPRTYSVRYSSSTPTRPLPSPIHIAHTCREARDVFRKLTKIEEIIADQVVQAKNHESVHLGFVMPEDVLHLGRGDFCRPRHQPGSVMKLQEFIREHKTLSVAWPLVDNNACISERTISMMASIIISSWADLGDIRHQPTIMVNVMADDRAGKHGKFHELTIPRTYKLAALGFGPEVCGESACAVDVLGDMFDGLLAEAKQHHQMAMQRSTGRWDHINTIQSLDKFALVRDNWAQIEPVLRQIWVGICKMHENDRIGAPWTDDVAHAVLYEENDEWAEEILKTAPRFRPAFLCTLRKPQGQQQQ